MRQYRMLEISAFARFGHLPRVFGRHLIDAVLPPRCLRCGDLVTAPDGLCAACWPELQFLSAPRCACCGYPFAVETTTESLCASCIADHPLYQRARAALVYDAGCKDMILAFKHADRTDLARPFARWMAQAGQVLLQEAEVITGVPLHWQRLLTRRYNQAALLARVLGGLAGRPVVPDLLQRRRATEKQGHLSRLGRLRNVKGAFVLHAKRRSAVEGRRVLLVDDVMTTGATVEGCCKVLLAAGATTVDVLTLARVVRPR